MALPVDLEIPFTEFDGQGPLLHFAHANAYPPGAYRQFLTDLAEEYRVLAMEQRPLWPEQRPETMDTWHLFADDLINFCGQQDLTGLIGVGHSLGAVVTMFAAVREPHLFHTLVLIEPVFLPPPILAAAEASPEQAAMMPFVQKALNRRNRWENRRAAFDRFRQKEVFRRLSDTALWDYVNEGLHERPDGPLALRFPREWEARIYSRPPTDVWTLLPEVTQPTLAMRGAHSTTVREESWQHWHSLQPQAHFVEIPEAGHLLPMEKPQVVARTVLSFLAEHSE